MARVLAVLEGDDSGSGRIRVWLATGVTDMRRGMNTLALQVKEDIGRAPPAGDLYVFRGPEPTKWFGRPGGRRRRAEGL